MGILDIAIRVFILAVVLLFTIIPGIMAGAFLTPYSENGLFGRGLLLGLPLSSSASEKIFMVEPSKNKMFAPLLVCAV